MGQLYFFSIFIEYDRFIAFDFFSVRNGLMLARKFRSDFSHLFEK